MSSFDEFMITGRTINEALEAYDEMEKHLHDKREELEALLISDSSLGEGATKDSIVKGMQHFLWKGDYQGICSQIETIRQSLETCKNSATEIYQRSEDFLNQLDGNTCIEPGSSIQLPDEAILYLNYGKKNSIVSGCERAMELAGYIGNCLKQEMDCCSEIMDDMEAYKTRVDDAVDKINRLNYFKESYEQYVKDITELEKAILEQLNSFPAKEGAALLAECIRSNENFGDWDEREIQGMMVYMQNQHSELLERLAVTNRYSSADCRQLVEQILRDETFEEFHQCVSWDTLERMGMDREGFKSNYGSACMEELRYYMYCYGIVKPESIRMFFATIIHESGNGLKTTEMTTEGYAERHGYTENIKGAGLIQVTDSSQQRFIEQIVKEETNPDRLEALELYQDGYGSNSNNEVLVDGLTVSQYIATYYPIESATWFWGEFDEKALVNGEAKSINEFVNFYCTDENHETVFLASQMAVNGGGFSRAKCAEMCIHPEKVVHDNGVVSFENEMRLEPRGWKERLKIYLLWDLTE